MKIPTNNRADWLACIYFFWKLECTFPSRVCLTWAADQGHVVCNDHPVLQPWSLWENLHVMPGIRVNWNLKRRIRTSMESIGCQGIHVRRPCWSWWDFSWPPFWRTLYSLSARVSGGLAADARSHSQDLSGYPRLYLRGHPKQCLPPPWVCSQHLGFQKFVLP